MGMLDCRHCFHNERYFWLISINFRYCTFIVFIVLKSTRGYDMHKELSKRQKSSGYKLGCEWDWTMFTFGYEYSKHLKRHMICLGFFCVWLDMPR